MKIDLTDREISLAAAALGACASHSADALALAKKFELCAHGGKIDQDLMREMAQALIKEGAEHTPWRLEHALVRASMPKVQ